MIESSILKMIMDVDDTLIRPTNVRKLTRSRSRL